MEGTREIQDKGAFPLLRISLSLDPPQRGSKEKLPENGAAGKSLPAGNLTLKRVLCHPSVAMKSSKASSAGKDGLALLVVVGFAASLSRGLFT